MRTIKQTQVTRTLTPWASKTSFMISCHGWMAMMPLSDLNVFMRCPSRTVSTTMCLQAALCTRSLPRMQWLLPSAARTLKSS